MKERQTDRNGATLNSTFKNREYYKPSTHCTLYTVYCFFYLKATVQLVASLNNVTDFNIIDQVFHSK